MVTVASGAGSTRGRAGTGRGHRRDDNRGVTGQPRRGRQAREPAAQPAQVPVHLAEFFVYQSELLVQLLRFFDEGGMEQASLLELRAIRAGPHQRLFRRCPGRGRAGGGAATDPGAIIEFLHSKPQPFDCSGTWCGTARVVRNEVTTMN